MFSNKTILTLHLDSDYRCFLPTSMALVPIVILTLWLNVWSTKTDCWCSTWILIWQFPFSQVLLFKAYWTATQTGYMVVLTPTTYQQTDTDVLCVDKLWCHKIINLEFQEWFHTMSWHVTAMLAGTPLVCMEVVYPIVHSNHTS